MRRPDVGEAEARRCGAEARSRFDRFESRQCQGELSRGRGRTEASLGDVWSRRGWTEAMSRRGRGEAEEYRGVAEFRPRRGIGGA
jgi:hypothetical protein